jgi:hypothetical protein
VLVDDVVSLGAPASNVRVLLNNYVQTSNSACTTVVTLAN